MNYFLEALFALIDLLVAQYRPELRTFVAAIKGALRTFSIPDIPTLQRVNQLLTEYFEKARNIIEANEGDVALIEALLTSLEIEFWEQVYDRGFLPRG